MHPSPWVRRVLAISDFVTRLRGPDREKKVILEMKAEKGQQYVGRVYVKVAPLPGIIRNLEPTLPQSV